MIREIRVSLFDLVLSLSNGIDLISPAIANHHKRVAYIAQHLSNKAGLPPEKQAEIILASLLHDSGGLSLHERLETLKFDFESDSFITHSKMGFLLLNKFEPMKNSANLVLHHHIPWRNGDGKTFNNKEVDIGSHIIHLADRIDVLLINIKDNILNYKSDIIANIKKYKGDIFIPELVDIFEELAQTEFFWLDVTSNSLNEILSSRNNFNSFELELDTLCDFGKMFCKIIDFKSRFTATHTSGVAASAVALAKLMHFSERECKMMKAAGYFHDLGKLAVPTRILDKPEKLTKDEFNIIKSHTYYTYRILENIKELEVINQWGAFHHERLNGKGYPFHHKGKDLSLGARIAAVADVFTALTEDRPYRKGTGPEKTLSIIENMAKNEHLDKNVVATLRDNYDSLNEKRSKAQKEALLEYQNFNCMQI